jgi:hypothetical protein
VGKEDKPAAMVAAANIDGFISFPFSLGECENAIVHCVSAEDLQASTWACGEEQEGRGLDHCFVDVCPSALSVRRRFGNADQRATLDFMTL